MADSKRQKIVDAVVARMQTILVTNGYQTNIGANVEDSRQNWQEEELPATSVFDLEATAEALPQNATRSIWTQPIGIRVALKKGSDVKAGRKVIADIYRAIGTDETWIVSGTSLAMFTNPATEGFQQPPDSFEVQAVEVLINVIYKTAKWNAEA